MSTNTLAAVRSGDLYALLSLCTDDELDPLVTVIVGKLSNMLDIDDMYKKHSPHHSNYHKKIGDEIRLFGGNTLANIGRGGEGPPYAEIVADVCKELSVEAGDDLVENEIKLLHLFFKQRWESLSVSERDLIAAQTRDTVGGQASNNVNFGAALAVGKVLSPAGLAIAGASLMSASLKVTVPCVLHIAYLRRKILEEGRGGVPEMAGTGKDVVEHASVSDQELCLVDNTGTAVIGFSTIPEPDPTRWAKVDDTSDISRLNMLVQALPSMGIAAEVAGGKYMRVMCDGALTKAADGFGYRGLSHGANGVAEHARLFDPTQLTKLVNVSALMNVASIALAQKHLADIRAKLTAILNEARSISTFLSNERRSVLTAAIHYFQQVAPAIHAGERPDSILHQLENSEADLLRAQHHLEEDIRHKVEVLNNTRADTSATSTSVLKDQQDLHVLVQEYALCLRARACGWQLLSAFPGSAVLKKSRLDDIRRGLQILGSRDQLMLDMDKSLRAKVQGLTSFWSAQSLNKEKLEMIRKQDSFLNQVDEQKYKLAADIQTADLMRLGSDATFALALKVSNGKIEAIQAL